MLVNPRHEEEKQEETPPLPIASKIEATTTGRGVTLPIPSQGSTQTQKTCKWMLSRSCGSINGTTGLIVWPFGLGDK